MRVGKFLMAAAVTSMTVAPAFAAPVNSASKLSLSSSVRASGSSAKKSKFGGEGIVIALVAVAAVAGGIVAVASNTSSTPKSP